MEAPPNLDKLTIIIPCFNEEESIPSLFEELKVVSSACGQIVLELLLINDGSSDKTQILLEKYMSTSSWCVGQVIALSRNFGKESAIICGLDQCHGEACIIMDADLQHPPLIIPEMVKLWKRGFSLVSAKRQSTISKYSRFTRIPSKIFYRAFRAFTNFDITLDSSDFRLLDKSVYQAIRQCRESIRFTKGFFAWSGFESAVIFYDQPNRQFGTSKWGNWKLWNYALDGIFNFSTIPLRIWSYLGLVVISIAFALGLRELAISLFIGTQTPGYASIFIAITFLGGVQLVGIGVIGEYVGRVFIESKSRPLYIIRSVYEK